MENVKNYKVNFIDNSPERITREQAEKLVIAIQRGGVVLIDGNIYQTHQITSITRDYEEEKFVTDRFSMKFLEEAGPLPEAKNSDYCAREEWDKMSLIQQGDIINKKGMKNMKIRDDAIAEKMEELMGKLVIKTMPRPSHQEMLESRADSGDPRAEKLLGRQKS